MIVTTPQEVALSDVRKEINFCKKTNLRVLGVVENMSGFVCPHCNCSSEIFPPVTGGAAKMCEDLGVPLLTQIPLEPNLLLACESGKCFYKEKSETVTAQKFLELAQKVSKK